MIVFRSVRVDHSLGERVDPFPSRFIRFNSNVLIVGASGSGKSFLGRSFSLMRSPKFVFTYKEDPLFKGSKVLDFLPSPFRSPFDFLSSFEVSFNGSYGFMLSDVLSLLSNSMVAVGSFDDLIIHLETEKSSVERFRRPVYSFLLARLRALYSGCISGGESLTRLNFGGMSDMQMIFFSDYYLRLVYNSVLDEGVLIDELHRLAPLRDGVLGRIVREIRSRGYVVGISQSLSDLGDLITNFGSIFVGNTLSGKDLALLGSFDSRLPALVVRLRPYEFLEVRSWLDDSSVSPVSAVVE